MTGEPKQSEFLETVFTAAVKEAHLRELNALPSEAELACALSFSPAFERDAAALTRKAVRAKWVRRLPFYVRRVAVILLTVFSTFCATLYLTPEVRASVQHIVMNWFDSYASFTFNPEEEAIDAQWAPNYLPAGFFLSKDRSVEMMQIREYRNGSDQRIVIQCMPADGTTMLLDNEHSTHIIIELDSGEGHLFEGFEGYPTMLLWERQGTSFLIRSDLKDNAEILRIAENMEPGPS